MGINDWPTFKKPAILPKTPDAVNAVNTADKPETIQMTREEQAEAIAKLNLNDGDIRGELERILNIPSGCIRESILRFPKGVSCTTLGEHTIFIKNDGSMEMARPADSKEKDSRLSESQPEVISENN